MFKFQLMTIFVLLAISSSPTSAILTKYERAELENENWPQNTMSNVFSSISSPANIEGSDNRRLIPVKNPNLYPHLQKRVFLKRLDNLLDNLEDSLAVK